MAYQRVLLTLDISRSKTHASLLETLKAFAYRLGYESYANARNMFDGELASKSLRDSLEALMGSIVDAPDWKDHKHEVGPNYFYLQAAFVSQMSYAHAFSLISIFMPYIRTPPRTPLAIVQVKGRPNYFVHFIDDGGELKHRVLSYDARLKYDMSPAELFDVVKDKLQYPPCKMEKLQTAKITERL